MTEVYNSVMTVLASASGQDGGVTTTTATSASARREQALEVAAQLLADHGPDALSARRVAAAIGASTQIVYTLFGGMPGLVEALYVEGFRRLAEAMDEAGGTPGTPEVLCEMGAAYRRFALTNPAFYDVMFGRRFPDWQPSPAARDAAHATFTRLVAAWQACLEAGTLVGTTAEEGARLCWSAIHGATSLDLHGLLEAEGADERARTLSQAVVDRFRP
jgi:AcrR family transcriptional regulator